MAKVNSVPGVENVKLGSLVVDRRVWVREHLDVDLMRCMVNDLKNGAVFPALLVDKNTNIIIGGNNRYHAYIEFYGKETAMEMEVLVKWIDMPPYEGNQMYWKEIGVMDNSHKAARLKHGDRVKVLKEVAEIEGDAAAVEFGEKFLSFTSERAQEILSVIKQVYESMLEKGISGNIPDKKAAKYKPNLNSGRDINIGSLKAQSMGLMGWINKGLNILPYTSGDNLTDAEISGLNEIQDMIGGISGSLAKNVG